MHSSADEDTSSSRTLDCGTEARALLVVPACRHPRIPSLPALRRKVELHEVRQSMQLVRREVHASVEQVWAWSRDTVRRALAASVGLVQARESTIESFKTQLAQTEAQV